MEDLLKIKIQPMNPTLCLWRTERGASFPSFSIQLKRPRRPSWPEWPLHPQYGIKFPLFKKERFFLSFLFFLSVLKGEIHSKKSLGKQKEHTRTKKSGFPFPRNSVHLNEKREWMKKASLESNGGWIFHFRES